MVKTSARLKSWALHKNKNNVVQAWTNKFQYSVNL